MRNLFIFIQFEFVSDHLNESRISAILPENFAFCDLNFFIAVPFCYKKMENARLSVIVSKIGTISKQKRSIFICVGKKSRRTVCVETERAKRRKPF